MRFVIFVVLMLALGFKKVESSQWALQYDWWSESVKKEPLTQAGLHFVGIGNYLVTFPATSKYCCPF